MSELQERILLLLGIAVGGFLITFLISYAWSFFLTLYLVGRYGG